jgi:hypothetical protein
MSDQELNEIEARAKKATRIGWEAVQEDYQWQVTQSDSDNYEVICRIMDGNKGEEDATFIASARQDIPHLIAEVRRLRKILASAGH